MSGSRRFLSRGGRASCRMGVLLCLLTHLGCAERHEPAADTSWSNVELNGASPALRERVGSARDRAQAGAVDALAELAQLYHANGYNGPAEQVYRILIERDPENPRWPYLAATLVAGYGRFEEAEPWLRQAVRHAPTAAVVHLKLGDLYFKSNRPTEAAGAFSAALAAEPESPWAQVGLARLAVADGRWPEARRLLERVIAQTPDFFGANSLLATVYERLGETAAAEAPRQRARAAERYREPSDPWTEALALYCYDPYRLQVMAAAAGQSERAQHLLERALGLQPGDPKTLRQLALLHLRRGQLELARERIDQALDEAPNDPETYLDLVPIYHAQGDREEAEARLREGLQRAPDHAGIHYELAMIATAQQALAEAVSHLEEARRLDPRQLAAYPKLATLYFRLDQPEQATAVLDAALAQDPDHEACALLYARYHIRSGRREAAADMIERADRAGSGSPEIDSARREFRARFGP